MRIASSISTKRSPLRSIRPPSQGRKKTFITDTIKNGKLPIIVGGTGLYIKALLFDYDFLPENQTTQDFSAYSNQELYDLVTEKDSAAVDKLHVNNRKRLIRTLQLLDKLPMNKTEFLAQQKKDMLYDALIIGLTLNRTVLHKIINERVEEMFNIGLCEEVRALLDSGIKFENQCMSAIGYKEFQPYFNKSCELKEVKEKIKAHTRQFAKRQYTWLNHQLPVSWVDVTEDNYLNKTTQMIENWLD